ncbi:methyl transferase [Dactylonectria estremocensis]|uniref:Methyl transferase n=1 Tax=Dactylonectria estremocensis TaxID=1079267 RepID=A0A9P9JEU2_9HYPO|nr:methyl transferase [Dactylonectria estremocensis]
MVAMSTQNSTSVPKMKIMDDWCYKHGRYFAASANHGGYLLPIDNEELNRLDILHKVFLVARGNKPFRSPIVRPAPKVMDLGTGTGIWGINVAEECFTESQIMAVDLNQIQPELIPIGVIAQQFDIEQPTWGPLLTNCDLIHVRMMLGSLKTNTWPHTYRKILDHLAPGIGHMEHVEIDWTPRWDDDKRPTKSAFEEWATLFYSGMDMFDRSARVNSNERYLMMEAAGFTDIKEEVIRAYVCPWSEDRTERELARWFNLGLTHSLDSLSLIPLIEKMGMTLEQVKELSEKVKKEICVLRYHTYCNIHVWTGRRPDFQ